MTPVPAQTGYANYRQQFVQQPPASVVTVVQQPVMSVVNVPQPVMMIQQPVQSVAYVQGPAQVQPPQTQSHLWSTQTEKFQVIFPNGVAYRRSPNYNDRRGDVKGPSHNTLIEGAVIAGTDGIQYVQTPQGYLPLSNFNGQVLIQKYQQPVQRPVPMPVPMPVPVPVQKSDPMQKSDPRPDYSKSSSQAAPNYAPSNSSSAAPAPPAYTPTAQTWTEYTDQATGKNYYHCKETNETTWDKSKTGGQFIV